MTNPLQSRFEKIGRPIDIGHEFEASETFPDADRDPIGFFRGLGYAALYTGAFAGACYALYCLGVGASRLFAWWMNP